MHLTGRHEKGCDESVLSRFCRLFGGMTFIVSRIFQYRCNSYTRSCLISSSKLLPVIFTTVNYVKYLWS